MRALLIITAVLFTVAGCSREMTKEEYMEIIKKYKKVRTEYSKALQEHKNKEIYKEKLEDLKDSVSSLPQLSDWDKDDSLKTYFSGAILNDLEYYHLVKDRPEPKNLQDSVYYKLDDVKHMEKSLGYDINIVRIILEEEKNNSSQK